MGDFFLLVMLNGAEEAGGSELLRSEDRRI